MRRLFDDIVERYTQDGNALCNEMLDALRPIFDREVAKDVSARDLALVGVHAVFELELNTILSRPGQCKHGCKGPGCNAPDGCLLERGCDCVCHPKI